MKCKNFIYIPIRYASIVANFILLKLPIYMHMEFLLTTICANHGTILIFLSKSNEMQCLFTFLLFYCDGQYIIIIRCTKCIWYFRNVILQVLTLFWGRQYNSWNYYQETITIRKCFTIDVINIIFKHDTQEFSSWVQNNSMKSMHIIFSL